MAYNFGSFDEREWIEPKHIFKHKQNLHRSPYI